MYLYNSHKIAMPGCPARIAIDGHSREQVCCLHGRGWCQVCCLELGGSQDDCSSQIPTQGERFILKAMPMMGKQHPYLKGIYSSLWDMAKQIHNAGDRPLWKNKLRQNQIYPKWLPHMLQYMILLAIYLSSSGCVFQTEIIETSMKQSLTNRYQWGNRILTSGLQI